MMIQCDICGKTYELNSDEFGDLSLLDLSCISLFGNYICRECNGEKDDEEYWEDEGDK